jgi:hypothetical protein
LVVAIDRGLLDQPEEVFSLLMFVHFVSSEKHPRSHTKNHEVKDKIFLLLRECYSLLRGVVGAELNNFSIRYLAFTLPPQRI